jgi:hypothetical protein
VEKGDVFTLVAAFAVVIVVAILANPQNLTEVQSILVPPTPTPLPVEVISTTSPTTVPTPLPVITPSPVPTDAPLYRIYFTDKPYTYPRFKMPESMSVFGAGDIPFRNQELVPFAYIEGSGGGLTQVFSVPYPVWVINTTVVADRNPQYARFWMVLCYASNGSILKGEEVLNRGTFYRIVQTSGTDLYMIISTQYVDQYHIEFETTRDYYNAYRTF